MRLDCRYWFLGCLKVVEWYGNSLVFHVVDAL